MFDVVRRRSTVALITFTVFAIAALLLVIVHKVKYGALSHVLLVNDTSGRDPTVVSGDMPTIVTGSTVLLEVKQRLGLSDSLSSLRRDVTARVAPKSSLMTIAVQNHDPQLAIAINNALADTCAKLYWTLAGSRYDEVTRRLRMQVETARQRLTTLNRRLERAAAGASYVGSQASLDSSATRLSELEENRGVANAQYVTDSANLNADHEQRQTMATIIRHEVLMNNGAYRETEALVGKDVAQYTTTRAGVTSIFPGIAGYTDKIQKEGRALDVLRARALAGQDAGSASEALRIVQTDKDAAAVQGDRAKLAAFDAQIWGLRSKLRGDSARAPSIGAMRAERDAAEAQLQAVSLRLTSAQANSAEASSLGEVVIVDRATEARPTLIGPGFLFALGLVAASLFAVAAAYISELIEPRLLGSDDVEVVYGRPILATLRAH